MRNSKQNKDTIHVQLYAGPGTGKSTTAAGVFSKLKQQDIDCELISEYAKQLVWEESFPKMLNQIYIFGKQHKRHHILDGKVDVVVTDSPFPLGLIYDEGRTEFLKELCMSEYNKLHNINIFINRKKKYNPNGRVQTLDQAIQKDNEVRSFLEENGIHYITLDGDETLIDQVVALVNDAIKNRK